MGKKGLTNLQLINGRWRGITPFRKAKACRNPLRDSRRTGEPSPSSSPWFYSEDWGKADGSYTQSMRQALWKWMSKTLGSSLSPLTFEYKLSRHKVITVTGTRPYIAHKPRYGRGKKGFVMYLNVEAIDGVTFTYFLKSQTFAWDRIIGREKILCLPESKVK